MTTSYAAEWSLTHKPYFMTKRELVMSLGAVILLVAGALAGTTGKFLTAASLYFTTGTGIAHCHLFSGGNLSSAFVTSPTFPIQAQIVTADPVPSQKYIFATAYCTKKVYFNP